MKKLIIIFLIAISAILLYQVIYSYSIIRFTLLGNNENIVGKPYTNSNILNPFKYKRIKNLISQNFINVELLNISDRKIKYLKANVDFKSGFEIMDIYDKEKEIYVFIKANKTFKDYSIKKYLFIFDNDTKKLVDIAF